VALAAALALSAAPAWSAPGGDGTGSKPATEATIAANQSVLDQLQFEDRQDFEDASRG
jgi:alkyl sulfatase BDS1-like metallo-beta-lactamase superfamily hydrolase